MFCYAKGEGHCNISNQSTDLEHCFFHLQKVKPLVLVTKIIEVHVCEYIHIYV